MKLMVSDIFARVVVANASHFRDLEAEEEPPAMRNVDETAFTSGVWDAPEADKDGSDDADEQQTEEELVSDQQLNEPTTGEASGTKSLSSTRTTARAALASMGNRRLSLQDARALLQVPTAAQQLLLAHACLHRPDHEAAYDSLRQQQQQGHEHEQQPKVELPTGPITLRSFLAAAAGQESSQSAPGPAFGGSLDECMRPHLTKLEREKQQMQMMGLLQPIRSTTADVRQTSSGVGDVGDLYNREI